MGAVGCLCLVGTECPTFETCSLKNFRAWRRSEVGDLSFSYTLSAVVGQGTYGQVWVARANDSGDRVAVKVLMGSRRRDFVQDVPTEAVLLELLRHRHIVNIRTVCKHAGGRSRLPKLGP